MCAFQSLKLADLLARLPILETGSSCRVREYLERVNCHYRDRIEQALLFRDEKSINSQEYLLSSIFFPPSAVAINLLPAAGGAELS